MVFLCPVFLSLITCLHVHGSKSFFVFAFFYLLKTQGITVPELQPQPDIFLTKPNREPPICICVCICLENVFIFSYISSRNCSSLLSFTYTYSHTHSCRELDCRSSVLSFYDLLSCHCFIVLVGRFFRIPPELMRSTSSAP